MYLSYNSHYAWPVPMKPQCNSGQILYASIVQWLRCLASTEKIWVRFPIGALIKMELEQELMQKGFRYEEGRLVKYTSYGRKRKGWKGSYRQRSRRFLKSYCERCLKESQDPKKHFTIHHIVPLSEKILITPENCQTLCYECHVDIEKEKNIERMKDRIMIPHGFRFGTWGEVRIL